MQQTMFKRISDQSHGVLSSLSPLAVLTISLSLAVLLNVVNYLVPANLFLFQLVPVALAGWYGSRHVGWLIAAYSATAGCVVEALEAHQSLWTFVRFETFLSRIVVLIAVAMLLSRLIEARKRQAQLTRFIVHDLRSPVASTITGLMTVEPSKLEPEDREILDLSLVSSQRALDLVNSLLDVSKLESGRFEVRMLEGSTGSVIDDAFDQIRLWARQDQIELAKDVREPAGVFDPDITTRVLVNLVSNALKFSPPNSTILVSVERTNTGGLRFSVKDEGPGIPPMYAQKIFEPFEQVEGTKGGTGIGLTFCRLAIQAQGGRIWVDSKVGEGTAMRFELPQCRP